MLTLARHAVIFVREISMPGRPLLITTLLLTSLVFAASPEFNWTPSGVISVGDRDSESHARYESCGPLTNLTLTWADGVLNTQTGRWITGDETFVIEPASWRGGAALETLVLTTPFDSETQPFELTVLVGTCTAGTWRFEALPGPHRFAEAVFAIPTSVWLRAVHNTERVPLTLSSSVPHLSFGYRCYVTRDWGVLGEAYAGDVRRARRQAQKPFQTYLDALIAEHDHDYSAAVTGYTEIAAAGSPNLARLARAGLRRCRARAALLDKDATLDVGYRRALYASAIQDWPAALDAWRNVVRRMPTNPDAAYYLAEAMEYNRMPVEAFAPVYERAGQLGERADCNTVRVLMAIHIAAVSNMCGELNLESVQSLQRDWRYVEQMVYGASRGAYKFATDYRIFTPAMDPWVMQAGWIFLPSDAYVPVAGTYDYAIGTAEFGASHAGGVDCGVNGSGGANIGAQRGWEVFLHEWNHQFDWTCVYGEQVPGYPTTHDSDGCGRQPIVNMGCGHRSSMRYYINRAQYRRQQPSDPLPAAACVDAWLIGGLVSAPEAPAGDDAAVEAWRKTRVLDTLALDDEAAIVRGAALPQAIAAHAGQPQFVDLRAALPNAPEKCVAYARTAIVSPTNQEVRLWLGCNDSAAVWLNGRKIHEGRYYACAKWEDANRPGMLANSGVLQQGTNVLVVKTERGGGDWGFSVHLVDFNNQPLPNLTVVPDAPGSCLYVPPTVGPAYRWADVKDDYMELLPRLTADDFAALTGIDGLMIASNRFFIGLPPNTEPCAGARYIAAPASTDRTFNNYLNWDLECAGALRFRTDGETRDLVFVRPEYYEDFLTLMVTAPEAPAANDAVVGYWLIPDVEEGTVPNRTPRAVLVIATRLPDYPEDDLDLLQP